MIRIIIDRVYTQHYFIRVNSLKNLTLIETAYSWQGRPGFADRYVANAEKGRGQQQQGSSHWC